MSPEKLILVVFAQLIAQRFLKVANAATRIGRPCCQKSGGRQAIRRRSLLLPARGMGVFAAALGGSCEIGDELPVRFQIEGMNHHSSRPSKLLMLKMKNRFNSAVDR